MDCFPEGLPKGTRIIPSEDGLASDEMAIVFLRHYIEHSDSGPEADWKLMLMNDHGSHCTPEFMALADENHIRPFPFIPNLKHCMQPLDAEIFQVYKHCHDIEVQRALSEFDIEYTLPRYIGELTKIRNHIFKKSIIRDAFEKSGMWPLNATNCIQQLKGFSPDTRKNVKEPTVPSNPRIHPTTPMEVVTGLQQWQEKIRKGIDPALRESFESFFDDAKKAFTQMALVDIQLAAHRKRKQDDMQQKSTSRKRSRPSGLGSELSEENSEENEQDIIEEEARKAKEAEAKEQQDSLMKLWRIEKNAKHVEGIAARKAEKARVRKIKELLKQGLAIPPDSELLAPIPDPEAIWKATDVIWQEEEAKKTRATESRANED